MDITYKILQEEHAKRLGFDDLPASHQTMRNHLSTLNTFLAFIGKTIVHRVGREFLADFNQKTKSFIDVACSTNKKTGADKMSHLRAWKKTVDQLLSSSKRAGSYDGSRFHEELRAAFAKTGAVPKTLAREVGASTSALQRWLCGAFPNERGLPTLRRLEKGLGLEVGALESLLPKTVDRPASKVYRDSFVERHTENTKDKYLVPLADLGQSFCEEWKRLLHYKTAEFPLGIKRSTRGVWRTLPLDKVSSDVASNSLAHTFSGHACPTACQVLQFLQAFLGYLIRDVHAARGGGMGRNLDEVQSIAVLAIPEFINGFFEFKKARSGGIVHGGHRTAAALLRNLLCPATGYLRQQPNLLKKVEPFALGRSWEELCTQTYELCGTWKRASTGKKSRDPKVPILNLLKLESPLKPLFRAIADLDKAAHSAAPGSRIQASLKRDALLLAIAISNPLRARTLTITKYVESGMGGSDGIGHSNLYQAENGQWRLRFQKGDFKNDGSRHEDYDAPLPRMLGARIEEYLLEYRPLLVQKHPDSPWLFPSGKTGLQIGEISAIIVRIAKRYIPEVSRLGPHAVRHIVATDFLAQNPGQFTVVAELLHDRLETVLNDYSHLKQEKSFNAHEKHLERVFSDV